MRIIGYTYEADMHCVACAKRASVNGRLLRDRPSPVAADEHGLSVNLRDREWNEVRPVFSTDENAEHEVCGDCFASLVRRFE